MLCSVLIGRYDSHGEVVEGNVGSGAIRDELLEEVPAFELEEDVAANSLYSEG